MKITVITVAYNAENTIVDTLLSVQSQKNVQIEHIIIDGSSTDRTQDLIVNNINSPTTKFLSEPDEGLYDAMNKGIGLATGDVVGFLNADDVYAHCDVLKTIVDALSAHDVDSIFADLVYVTADLTKMTRKYSSKRFKPSRIAYGWVPAHPTLYIKRNKMSEIGLFKTHYKIAGDFEYIVRAYCTHKITYHYLDEVLVCMRLGGVSTESWRSNVLHNKEIVKACRANGLYTNLLKIYSKYPYKLLELLSRRDK